MQLLSVSLAAVVALGAAGCSGVRQPSGSTLREPSDSPASIGVTSDISAVATEIALGDERLATFLSEHPFEVEGTSVRSGSEVDVFVRLDQAVPTLEWPLDVCDNRWANMPMDGVHWRVDLDSHAVVTVSPMWGSASCVPYSY